MTRPSYRSMASWIDKRQQLNYLLVYPDIAPDALVSQLLLILKIAINRGAGSLVKTKWRKYGQSLNLSWHFKLTLLPSEILNFLPWVVSLIESQDNDWA